MKPIIQGPLDALAKRIAALEAELARLRGTPASITNLSGTINARFEAGGGGGLAFVTTDVTLTGDGTTGDQLSASPLSGTINARFIDLSGSINAAIAAGGGGGLSAVSHDSSLSGDGTVGTPLSASPLSGTINAAFAARTTAFVTASLSGVFGSYTSTMQAQLKNRSGGNLGRSTVCQLWFSSSSLGTSYITGFSTPTFVSGSNIDSTVSAVAGRVASTLTNSDGLVKFSVSFTGNGAASKPAYLNVGHENGVDSGLVWQGNGVSLPEFSTWTSVTPVTTPTARYAGGMCFFPGVGLMMVGGSANGSTGITDGAGTTAATWVWNGTNWTDLGLSAANGAPRGFGGGMVYDPIAGKALCVPAYHSGFVTTVAEFNGTSWTTYAAAAPSSVWGNLTYDQIRQQVIYATWTGPTYYYDWTTHAFVSLGINHSNSYYPAMGIDPVTRRSMLINGNIGRSTYDLTSVPSWAVGTSCNVPTVATYAGHSFVFCEDRLTTYLKMNGETQKWDGALWSRLTLVNEGPGSSIFYELMAYDVTNSKMVLFGGTTSYYSGATSATYILE